MARARGLVLGLPAGMEISESESESDGASDEESDEGDEGVGVGAPAPRRRAEVDPSFVAHVAGMSDIGLMALLESKSPLTGLGLDEQAVVKTVGLELKARAWSRGLSPDDMLKITTFITTNTAKIKDATLKPLLRALVPASATPVQALVDMLGILRPRSPPIRRMIFMWAVIVFDTLDAYDILHSLYPVFFHYVTYDSLRPFACHILCLLTRREDVLPFRVRKLFDLYKRQSVAKENALIALLMVYKDYSPELVPIARPYGYKPRFKTPHVRWLNALRSVQARRPESELEAQALAASLSLPHGTRGQSKRALDAFAPPEPGSSRPRRGRKKRKLLSAESLIPELDTAVPPDTNLKWDGRLIALDQIASIDELIASLDSVKLPKQLAAVFSERSLQHIVSLDPAPSHILRISHWLSAKLRSEHITGSTPLSPMALELLTVVRDFARFFKEIPPVLEDWLSAYLFEWNGAHALDLVVDLLTYLRPMSWDALLGRFLDPLQVLFFANGITFQIKVIHALKTMLLRWVSFDWVAWATNLDAAVTAAEAENSPIPEVYPMPGFIFAALDTRANYWRCFYSLIAWLDKLSSTALLMANSHAALESAVLSLFELFTQAIVDLKLPFFWIPSPGIVYPCLLSPAALAPSRISHVLGQLKNEFHRLQTERDENVQILGFEAPVSSRAPLINAYVLDASNMFYRSQAFSPHSKISMLFKLPAHVIDAITAVPSSAAYDLSIASNLATTSLAAEFLAARAHSHALPGADSASLADIERGNLKTDYLDFLNDAGLTGLHSFLHTVIVSLQKRVDDAGPASPTN